jgi:HTH-type transcriptional regulator/antitoxin HipB
MMATTRLENIVGERTAQMSPAERQAHDANVAAKVAAMLLGDAVQDARQEAGLTQAELAERIGIKQPSLCRIETGQVNVSISMLARIAEALGVPLKVTIGTGQATIRNETPATRPAVVR